MKRLRIYVDTSVFGGCFDSEFSSDSRKLFSEIGSGRFLLVVSRTTLDEINDAPKQVQQVLGDLPEECVEILEPCDEIERLAQAYIDAGIIGAAYEADARHIAAASIAQADMVVSWNFKHIVHYEKIRGYQAINMLNGYESIRIFSPKEVIE